MSSQALPAPANQLFRYLFEQASLGIAVEDLEGKILRANPALCSMLGYTEQELCSMSCSEFANPEDSQDDWALFQQLRAGVIDHYSLEKRYIKKDGARIWGRLNVSLFKEGDGASPLVFAFVEEITERKFAEQEMIRSNERFRLAVEASKSVGWEWDLKTGRDSWFGDVQTMFGVPSDTFVGRAEDFYGYVHPDDRQMVAKAVADARQTRKPYSAEFRVVRRDGMLRWVSATGKFYYGTSGDAERMLGMATDITERKRAEEALRGSEERLRLAAKAGKMYAYEWDPRSDVVTRSEEYANIPGLIHPGEQITRQQLAARVHPDDRARFMSSVDYLTPENPTIRVSYRLLRSDGAVAWLEKIGSAFFDAQGRLLRVMGMVADITERKQAEEALRQKDNELAEAQRLAGIGSWVWDAQKDKVIWSKELYRLVGRDPKLSAPSFKEHPSLFTAKSWERLESVVKEALTTGVPYELDLEILTPESTTKSAIARGEPVRDAGGQIIGLRGTVQDITERKRAEEALRESEQRLRLAIQAGSMYAFDWNVATDVIVRSKESVEILNWEKPETDTGKAFHARVHPDDLALYTAMEAGLTRENPTYQITFRTLNPEGRIAWLEDTGRASFDPQGKMVRVTGTVADVTERRRVEEALKQSEEKFSKAFQQSPMALTLTSARDHRYIDVNETFERITGWRRDEVIGRTPFDIGIWVDSVRRLEFVKRVLAEGAVRDYEVHYCSKDGSQRVGLGAGELIQIANEPCILSVIADITERKQTEEALHESEERFRLAAQAGKMFAYEWDAATDKIVRSEGVPLILGIDAAAHTTGRELLKMVPPEDRARLIAGIAQLSPEEPHLRISYRMVRSDGSVIWVERTSRAYFDQQGKMLRMVGMIADITERKQAETALRETEDKLRLLLDSTAEAIYGIDLEHRCTFCNPACLRMLGYERVDDVLGKNMHDLIHHTRADGSLFPVEECRVHGVIQAGEGVHAEDELFWRASGTSFPVEYWSHPQRSGQETVGAVVAFVDITQRKLAEAALSNVSGKLIEAQEQERIRIGRELHDDIGQRLALLAVELQQLHGDRLILPRVRARIGKLQKQISEIANDTQSLSHELHSAKLQYLGLAAAMRGFCREFSEQQKAEIDFKTHDLPSPLPADISLCFFRVLQEALHNAVKHSGVKHFEVRLWGNSDEMHLTVRDSGVGFDREAAKATQGLGLISMEERLKLVNGTLSIESQPKRGATIHARAPLSWASDSVRAAG